MPKFTDYYSDPEVKNIMEKFIEKFPGMFEGFNVDLINVVITKKKKSRKPIRLIPVRYPLDVYVSKPYIVEVFEQWWKDMNPKQKNLAVFHVMCAIPEGGFDEQSSHYAKKVRPDVEMYLREFAASGGVPNWLDNPNAADPMDANPMLLAECSGSDEDGETGSENGESRDAIPDDDDDGKDIKRVPVTKDAIANVGT